MIRYHVYTVHRGAVRDELRRIGWIDAEEAESLETVRDRWLAAHPDEARRMTTETMITRPRLPAPAHEGHRAIAQMLRDTYGERAVEIARRWGAERDPRYWYVAEILEGDAA